MTKPLSKVKLRNFQRRIEAVLTEEMQLRSDIKRMYDQLAIDTDDDAMALRQVRQAYFNIQKKRMSVIIAERMEFHPFFGAHFMSSIEYDDDIIDDEDDDIL